MIKASANTTRLTRNGKTYRIYDAYQTKAYADKTAKGLRTLQGRVHKSNYTSAIVVDLGKSAGRLRYAIFIASGKKI